MTNLFVFFALPLATILLAIVLQKVLKCPILVAITFFAIYLIVAFVAFPGNLAEAIIAAIIYSIIAYVTAILVQLFCALRERFGSNSNRRSSSNNNNQSNCCCGVNNNDDSLLRISYNCPNGQSNDLLTVNSNCGGNSNNEDESCCCNNNSNSGVAVSARVVPSNNNGGRTGCIRGCYRRM